MPAALGRRRALRVEGPDVVAAAVSIANALFLRKEVDGVRRFRHEDVRLAAKAFEDDVPRPSFG